MKQPELYCRLSLDDRLALLNLIERAIRGTDGSREKALLAADSVLSDLDVSASLGEIGQRIGLCIDSSLRDLAITFCEMEAADERTFSRLVLPDFRTGGM